MHQEVPALVLAAPVFLQDNNIVCTCWLVLVWYLLACVYLDCVSWCFMLCVCHGVLACSMICPIHLTCGRVSMALAPPAEGLEMYFPPPNPCMGSTVEATESLQ